MSSPFQTLHHVCIVVHDLAKAVAYYETLGIGPWYDYPKGGAYVAFDVPNPEASKAMRYKCADLGQRAAAAMRAPHMDCPQRRFLDAHGEGVYHLGFEVPDLAGAKSAMREARRRGDRERRARRWLGLRLLRHARRRRRHARGKAHARR